MQRLVRVRSSLARATTLTLRTRSLTKSNTSLVLSSFPRHPPLTPRAPCRTFSAAATPLRNTHSPPEEDEDAAMGKKDEKGGKTSFLLKTPKGTRDWDREDMILRDRIFSSITEIFKRHGGTNLDTPVFELKEILSGKYGEDSKLIYDLADQGGELCSLRYDLTVPLARYLAMKDIKHLKRYQIAKVYRRDQPAVAKGRMREFYQCDFDIAGVYDRMIPDAEILRIIVEVFEALGWENITIKMNHRKVLDGLFQVAGVPEEKIRSISSAVDKLDKMPWEEVKKEMLEKGLEFAVADKIGEYVKHKGGKDILALLKADAALLANENAKKGIEDMELLFTYLDAFGVTEKCSFDLSLARGLDYYTGVIYEVVTEGSAPAVQATAAAQPQTPAPAGASLSSNGSSSNNVVVPVAGDKKPGSSSNSKSRKKKTAPSEDDDRSDDPTIGVGSIAAGGRYDELVGMFSGKSEQIPCVGISFGVDRIFSVMKARLEREHRDKGAGPRTNEVDVYVMALGSGLLVERMAVASQLWAAGVKAEFSAKVRPKLPQQFKAAENGGVPLAVILGESELAEGRVRLKVLGLKDLPKDHPDKDGKLVLKADLVAEIKKLL